MLDNFVKQRQLWVLVGHFVVCTQVNCSPGLINSYS